jgi:ceramide glucosyltransferase
MVEILAGIMDSPLEALAYALAILSCFYTLLSIAALRRFPRAWPEAAPFAEPGVSVLKPLYGAEPGLYEHLASFCRQSYAGPVQILFGAHTEEDAAAAVARQIIDDLRAGRIDGVPAGLTAQLVVDPTAHGSNGKVSNLINLSRHVAQELVVLADSDIIVAPDYLARLAAALETPGVGAVTSLYRGVPMAGLWSRLCAMGVDYGFLPNVVTGVALNMAEPCIGATIALRHATLKAIGGFERVRDQLADDYELGAAVRALGQKVIFADFAVGHAHGERSFIALWRQEMRWARTIKSLDPLGYFGSVVTFPLAWSLFALAIGAFDPAGLLLVAAALLCRLTLKAEVDRRFAGVAHAGALLPLRDLLSFAVYAASFIPGRVRWRGREYALVEDGAMIEDGKLAPTD